MSQPSHPGGVGPATGQKRQRLVVEKSAYCWQEGQAGPPSQPMLIRIIIAYVNNKFSAKPSVKTNKVQTVVPHLLF